MPRCEYSYYELLCNLDQFYRGEADLSQGGEGMTPWPPLRTATG